MIPHTKINIGVLYSCMSLEIKATAAPPFIANKKFIPIFKNSKLKFLLLVVD